MPLVLFQTNIVWPAARSPSFLGRKMQVIDDGFGFDDFTPKAQIAGLYLR